MKAIKQVDVVISTTGKTSTDGSSPLLDQFKLIAAIKEAGNIKVLQLSLYDSTCDPKIRLATVSFDDSSNLFRSS